MSDLIFTLSHSSSIDSLDSMSDMVDSLDLNGLPSDKKKHKGGLYGVEKPATGVIRMGGFILKETIARGNCASIKTAIGPDNQTLVVLKLIDKDRLTKRGLPADEIMTDQALQFLKTGRHPNIIQLAKYKTSSTQIAMVLEPLNPRHMVTVIASPNSTLHPYSELSAQIILSGLASALSYFHGNKFILRGLNHENVLIADGLQKDAGFWRPKLVGCSFLYSTAKSSLPSTTVGSTLYAAPEIGNGPYDEKVDIYALGVFMFFILTGEFPLVQEGRIQTASPFWKQLDSNLIRLLESMLSSNPSQRPNAAEIMAHRWLKRPREKSLTEVREFVAFKLKELEKDGEPLTYFRQQTSSKPLFAWPKRKEKAVDEILDSQGRVKVAEVGDENKWPKNITKVKVKGHALALCFSKGNFYAVANPCSHANGPMDQGDIEDFEGSACIRCPIHGFKFNLETGYTKSKKYRQKTFPVVVHDDAQSKPSVWVEFEK